MGNSSDKDNYLSAVGVLNDFSDEMYNQTVILYEPMVSGKNILKRIRKSHEAKVFDFILNSDTKQQEKLIDSLTDLISINIMSDLEKFKDNVRDIFLDSDLKKYFESAETSFKKLDPTLKKQVIRFAILKLFSNINILRREIGYRIWKKNSKINELMITDQLFYKIEENLKDILVDMNPKKIVRQFNFSLYLVLKMEAYKRNKIKLKELERSISCSYLEMNKIPDANYITSSDYNVVLGLLGG